jgi:hypothetical protein
MIAWLRRQGEGYQARLNALLRSAMLKDLKRSTVKPYKRLHAATSRFRLIFASTACSPLPQGGLQPMLQKPFSFQAAMELYVYALGAGWRSSVWRSLGWLLPITKRNT